MAENSKPSRCHLCNGTMEKQCILSFDCSHQLCSKCAQLTEGRSVCPTCSPIIQPCSAEGNSNNNIGFPPNYTRMYSKNTEQPSPKSTPTSKDIDSFDPSNISSPTLLTVPSSFSHSSSSSPSASPRRLSPIGRASSENCIVARMDYAEDAAENLLVCQCNHVLTRQAGHYPEAELETSGRHPGRPGSFQHDGKRGTGSVRRDLVDYHRTLKEHSESFLERLNQTGINEAVFSEKIAAVEQEVKRQARERRRAIDRAEKELLLKLEARMKEQTLESEAVRHDTELCIGQLDSLTKTLEEALEKRDEGDLDQVLFEVQGDVRRALECRVGTVCFGSVSFIYSEEHILQEDSGNILGEVEFLPSKNKVDDHLMFVSSPLPLIHSIDHPPSHFGQAVTGLTVLASRIYVIRTNSHNIDVYHSQFFTPLQPITLLHLMTPMLVPSASDLSSCPKSQTLYVSDTANGYVYRIDTDGKLLNHWRLPQNFTGLSVTEIGTVLAGSGSKIVEYDQSGKTLRTIGRPTFCKVIPRRGKNGGGAGIVVGSPSHFVRLNSGGIIVADWKRVQGHNHVVYEIDERGQMVEYFGGAPGSGDDELNEPCCLATAPLGHVIVADRVNRRVKLLDSGLKFVRNLVDEGQRCGEGHPNRIFLDAATGRLYVGTTDGRVRVYRTIF